MSGSELVGIKEGRVRARPPIPKNSQAERSPPSGGPANRAGGGLGHASLSLAPAPPPARRGFTRSTLAGPALAGPVLVGVRPRHGQVQEALGGLDAHDPGSQVDDGDQLPRKGQHVGGAARHLDLQHIVGPCGGMIW